MCVFCCLKSMCLKHSLWSLFPGESILPLCFSFLNSKPGSISKRCQLPCNLHLPQQQSLRILLHKELISIYTNCVSTGSHFLVSAMDHSKGSTPNPSVSSTQIHNSENATPGRYTCYDTGIFLSLYIVLATTSTVNVASEAFEQSEKVVNAQQSIEITDAHRELARRPIQKTSRGIGDDQAGEKMKRRMTSRIGKILGKVAGNLKVE